MTTVLGHHVRARVPIGHRRRLARQRLRLRLPTARLRVLPDFLVIGAQRAGTSSLYRYLGAHPDIAPSLRKETEYFSRCFDRDIDWYRAHFPLAARRRVARLRGAPLVTFEATPDYLMHPLAAGRVASVLPDVKLVALLRDPAERALSHWQHMVLLGYEDLPFSEALAREEERITPDLERLEVEPTYDPRALLRFSYAHRGFYDMHLARWLRSFPSERFLVLDSESLYRDPAEVCRRVAAFVGVRDRVPERFPNYSAGSQRPVPRGPDVAAALEGLRERYAGSQLELARLRATLPPAA